MNSMDTDRKRQEVVALINNIKEHSDRLKDHPSIPVLELNVILSKITKLHEKASVLKHLVVKESGFKEDYVPKDPLIKFTSNPVESKNALLEEMKSPDFMKVEEHEEETPSSSKSDEKEEKPKEKLQSNHITEAAIPDPALSSQKNIGKLEDYLDMNAKYSTEEDPSLSHQLKKQPISNLMTAIGLNERYLFANQLFGGSMENFMEEVKKLNSCESATEAMDYFDRKLCETNKWDKNDELVKGFRLLVERRFH